jgi:hypothetical protein
MSGTYCDIECDYCPHGVTTGRIERLQRELPEVAAKVVQAVVDNPAQFALLGAGTIVATRAAMNIMRPRSAFEALALMVVLQIGLPKLALMAVERGWITFRVRDIDGNLVPLVPGKAEDAAA